MTTEANADLLSSALSDPNAGKDPYAELVGEGKKYKDNTALAKSRIEADKMIETLIAEKKEMKEELARLSAAKPGEDAVKSLIERIETATKQSGQPAGTLSREEIEKLVKEGIATNDTERSKRANYLLSNAELNNHFKGDAATAAKHLNDRIVQLGVTPESVRQIAESNPKMFKDLFVPAPSAPRPNNTVPPGRIAILPDGDGGERGASYYAKLKKEMGAKFYEPAIQQQRFKDRERLGERFNTL